MCSAKGSETIGEQMLRNIVSLTIVLLSFHSSYADADCITDANGSKFCTGDKVYALPGYGISASDYWEEIRVAAAKSGNYGDKAVREFSDRYQFRYESIPSPWPDIQFNGFHPLSICGSGYNLGYHGVVAGILNQKYVTVSYPCNEYDYKNDLVPRLRSITTTTQALRTEVACQGGVKVGSIIGFETASKGVFGQVLKCYSNGAYVGFFKTMYKADTLMCLVQGGTQCENYNHGYSTPFTADRMQQNMGFIFLSNDVLKQTAKSVDFIGDLKVGAVVNYSADNKPCGGQLSPAVCAYNPADNSQKVAVRMIFSNGQIFVSEQNRFDRGIWSTTISNLTK